MTITLPQKGQGNWDVPLNSALTNLDTNLTTVSASALTKIIADNLYDHTGSAVSAVSAHSVAADPHGDRGWAVGQFYPVTGYPTYKVTPSSGTSTVEVSNSNAVLYAKDTTTGLMTALRNIDKDTIRFDSTAPITTVFRKKVPSQNTVTQSMSVDSLAGVVYTVQLIQGGVQLAGESAPVSAADRSTAGDYCINKMTLAGDMIAKMYVKGGGHGMTIAIEYGTDGVTYLWVDGDSSTTGFARGLHRITFTADAVLVSTSMLVYRPFGTGMHGVSAAIDPSTRRMMVHYTYPDGDATARRYAMFDLLEASQNVWNPMAFVSQVVNQTSPGVGTYQGHAVFGNYIYSLDGDSGVNNMYITTLDWRTGQQMQRTLLTYESGMAFREPEGMCIWIPDMSAPTRARLCFGISDGVSGGRDYTLAYYQAGLTYGDTSFSKSLLITSPTAAANYVVWRAPKDCTISAVRGYRIGGTATTINVTNAGSDVSTTNLSLVTDSTWASSAGLQNTTITAGSTLIFSIRSVTGTPSAVTIQVDLQG